MPTIMKEDDKVQNRQNVKNNQMKSEIISLECFRYYVDPVENTPGNFDNYLIAALTFINKLPCIDWSRQIEERKVILKPTNKKTLILDLDETLIHADLNFTKKDHDALIQINFSEGESCLVPMFLRPGLQKFLEFASKNFEVICFTSSKKEYADSVIDYIDCEKIYFSHRLYRESCLSINDSIFLKDITILKNRELKNVIIVDNSLIAFSNQISNGILVPSFYHDKNDNILDHLIEYLTDSIFKCEDVRQVNKEVFGFEELANKLKKVRV